MRDAASALVTVGRALWARVYGPWLVRSLPMPEVMERLTWRSRRLAALGDNRRALVAAERIAATLRLPNTCLYRTLARYSVLSGSAPEGLRFVMGIRKENQSLIGHAWLERNGQPLGETVDPRLVVTFSYPPAQRAGG